ncbi:glycoside-pentoside-hexuronide (GPH):cation symporter [Neobacillus cucumis]|uniref:glycoside-pentoside-hexuronide (GPH):cation symporter n=1 Tax=Neobacillus cucumis TaxID=1740721 RepID=UPI001964CC80|nr:glycoside-pentoside-hexuronide (GPH):cation symporter [Neobacillus cucumis]MBM7655516.1 sugar (glycoside-pentoside-hexuronide) transporter [Neobacillus cucumis]
MNSTARVWRQRIGYGAADLSCNLIWQMIGLYLMFYYTDVVGLKAVQVSLLFLLTRIVDGVADVMMGIIIDKTNTKWGKSRPYFLWGAIPFALLGILAFYVPDVGPVEKLLYAYMTYMGLSMVYTMVNIPLASILPSLTSEPQERTMLSTVRILFSAIGATAVSVLTMPMVKALGGGSQASGFFWTMIIFSIIACFFFFFTFKNVEEKVKVQVENVTVKQAFSTLKGNKPYYIFALNILFMWGSYFFQQGALIYYFTYNLDRADLVATIAGIGSFVPLAGTILTPFLAKKMYKRTLFIVSSVVNLVGILIMLLAGSSIPVIIVGAVIAAFGSGTRSSIYFSMQADPVDYGEWKTGINASGLLSALNGFLGKVTMAVAGALFGLMLNWGNYVPNATQTDHALFAIKLGYLIIPAVLVVISMITMCFYNLDKIYPEIRAEMDARKCQRENQGIAV